MARVAPCCPVCPGAPLADSTFPPDFSFVWPVLPPCCPVLPRLPRRPHWLTRLFRRISVLCGPCCPVLPRLPRRPHWLIQLFRRISILGGPCCPVLPRGALFAPAASLADSTFPPDFNFGWPVLPRVAPCCPVLPHLPRRPHCQIRRFQFWVACVAPCCIVCPAAPLPDSTFPPDFNFGWPVQPRVAPLAPPAPTGY